MTEGKINITANVISFLCVGFATLTIACIPPGEQFSGDWTLGGIFYTLPVSVVGASMVRYNPSLFPYALAVQVLFFFLFRWLLKRCLRYYVNYTPPAYLQYSNERIIPNQSTSLVLSADLTTYLCYFRMENKRYYIVGSYYNFLADKANKLLLFPDLKLLKEFLLTNKDFEHLNEWAQAIGKNNITGTNYNLDLLAGDSLPVSDVNIEELFETIVMIRDYAIQHNHGELKVIVENEMFDYFINYAMDCSTYGIVDDMDPEFDTAAFIQLCNRLHTVFKGHLKVFEEGVSQV